MKIRLLRKKKIFLKIKGFYKLLKKSLTKENCVSILQRRNLTKWLQQNSKILLELNAKKF